jgi:hypothetical protein
MPAASASWCTEHDQIGVPNSSILRAGIHPKLVSGCFDHATV